MIQGFRDRDTERAFQGQLVPDFQGFSASALRRLDMLNRANSLAELRVPRGNRLEALSSDRAGQYSIRINRQWRICFRWTDDGPDDVEIVDYH